MQKFWVIGLATLATALTQPARAQPARALHRLLVATLDSAGPAPVVSAFLTVSSPTRGFHWAGQAGQRMRTKAGAAVGPRTPVRLAIVTKTFTATVVLQLVEEGRLALDAPLTNYLAASFVDSLQLWQGQPTGRALTVRRLLRHTTGLADYLTTEPSPVTATLAIPPGQYWTVAALWRAYFARGLPARAHFAPNDTLHAYSDTNYLLLGTLVERVCGQPLAAVYRARIFQPLRLRSAYLEYYEPAPTHQPPAHPYWGMRDVGQLNTSFDWGAGGLVMTVGDLHTFWVALLSGRLFRQAATRQLLFDWVPSHPPGPERAAYGAGVARLQMAGLPVIIGHAGFYKAFVAYLPQQDYYLSGTLNQAEADHRAFLQRVLALLP